MVFNEKKSSNKSAVSAKQTFYSSCNEILQIFWMNWSTVSWAFSSVQVKVTKLRLLHWNKFHFKMCRISGYSRASPVVLCYNLIDQLIISSASYLLFFFFHTGQGWIRGLFSRISAQKPKLFQSKSHIQKRAKIELLTKSWNCVALGMMNYNRVYK